MNILILGGTSYVGRYIVSECIKRKHDISIFNRNVTNNNIFPDVPRFQGDRLTNDYSSLLYEQFDVVIDTWYGEPSFCKTSIDFFKNNIHLYVYISSCSVYDIPSNLYSNYNTNQSNFGINFYKGNEYGYKQYCINKLKCEREIYTDNEDKVLILRPGIILGEYDNTNRFDYKSKHEAYWKNTNKKVKDFITVEYFASHVINSIEKNKRGVYEIS
jgi:2'-hydroxyisoflavone reductase